MATHKGSEGVVKAGGNTIAEVTGFSFDETADTIESTALSNSARAFVSDLISFTGTIDCFFDETDTAQNAMTAGAQLTVELYPEGTASGATYFTGTVIITSISRANAINSLVTASFGFQGTGGLTSTTV